MHQVGEQSGQLCIGIPFGELVHAGAHVVEQFRSGIRDSQSRTEQAVNAVAEGGMVWGVLVHDHGTTQFGGAGGIGVLVLIGCLGERHQGAGRATHCQFAQTAGTGSANRQVGMLQ